MMMGCKEHKLSFCCNRIVLQDVCVFALFLVGLTGEANEKSRI